MQDIDKPEDIRPTKNTDAGRSKQRKGRAVSWRAALWLVIIGLLAMVLLQAGWRTPPDPLEMSLDRLTAGHRFDLTTWEIDADFRASLPILSGTP